MLKFVATDKGRTLVGLGLSDGNLVKLREKRPILVKLDAQLGLSYAIDVLICWGVTEASLADDIQQILAGKPTAGSTGDFPMGQLRPDDAGGLVFKVGHDQNRVIVDFGEGVTWLGLDKATALAFAENIREHATAIDVAVPPENA